MGSNRKLGSTNRVHMIGIGGSGMLGIASILLKKGFFVSGSDVSITKDLLLLQKEGALIQEGHKPDLIKRAQKQNGLDEYSIQVSDKAFMKVKDPPDVLAPKLSALSS